MVNAANRKVLLKEHSPRKGDVLKNLNFKIPANVLLKLNILADHEGKYLKYYLVDVLTSLTKYVRINIDESTLI